MLNNIKSSKRAWQKSGKR